MSLRLSAWHARYIQQARWTQQLRNYLYPRAGLPSARRLLEVGCGTGAVLPDLVGRSKADIYGLDLDPARLEIAAQGVPGANLVCGDALRLPFSGKTFDLVFCHFLLLWVSDPLQALNEMRRVTRRAGAVLALAEPDYGGRIDFPIQLATLGDFQREGLKRQGADPLMGRRLAGLLAAAGLGQIESGVLGGQWTGAPSPEEWELEWQVLRSDLSGSFPEDEIKRLQELDRKAWQHRERVLFVPTFYAWGRVP